MKKYSPLAFCLVLMISTILPAIFAPTSLHAADPGINLQISPLPIDLVVEPGKTITSDLRIRNGGVSTEKIKVTLRKFSSQGEEGKIVLEDRGPTDDYFDWVKFSKDVFDAPPGEWQTIKMTINVPSSAAFGYYYAVQFARAEPAKAAPGKSAIEGAVAIFVLLEVSNPGAKRKAEVVEFSANQQVYEFLPTTFNVKVKNTGNVHVRPEGSVYVESGDQSTDQGLAINPGGGAILPGATRIFFVNWQDGFPVYVEKLENSRPVLDKNGKLVSTLKWDFSQVPKLRIGKYTAKLLLAYDNGQRDVPIEAAVSFFVIPWRIIAGVGLVTLFIIIGFAVTGKKIWGRVSRKK